MTPGDQPLRSAAFEPAPLGVDELTPRDQDAERHALAYARLVEEVPTWRPSEAGKTDAVSVVEQRAGGWIARWALAPQGGALVVRAVHLEPEGQVTPHGGVTANLLRALSPAAAAIAGAEEAQEGDRMIVSGRRRARERVAEQQPEESPSPRRPGRPRLSDDELADVAIAYIFELRNGRGVLGRLAAEFDREESTMRDRVRLARRAGFLTDAPKAGSKGGSPGPALKAYLERRYGLGGADDEH